MKRVTAAALLGALLLTGCSVFQEEEQERLPGKRVSVMLHERTISADPDLAGERILLPAPAPNDEWPQSGGYPNHAMHHMRIPESVGLAWRADVGTEADEEVWILGSPVVANGTVFAMDAEARVTAVAEDSGKTLWSRALTPDEEDDDHISGGIGYYRGRVIATTGFGEVFSLDAETGEIAWQTYARAPVRAAPAMRGGRVFVVTVDNRLLALRADNGEEIWTHTGVGESASLLGGGTPAVDSDVVVVPYSSGDLVALDAENGRVLWSDTLGSIRRTDTVSTISQIRGNPVIDRGRVIAVSHGGTMASIDLRTGQRIWTREIGGFDNPWVAGDYIFVLTNDSEIAAVSREDGRIYWVRGLPRFEDPEDREDPIIWTGPILASDRLILAGSHGEAWAVSPYSGDLLGRVELPDGVLVPPVIANDTVYFLANDAELVAYR